MTVKTNTNESTLIGHTQYTRVDTTRGRIERGSSPSRQASLDSLINQIFPRWREGWQRGETLTSPNNFRRRSMHVSHAGLADDSIRFDSIRCRCRFVRERKGKESQQNKQNGGMREGRRGGQGKTTVTKVG